ncbi:MULTISPECIES: PAS domain-containing protein [Methylobacterium]|uniref:PAS domain-containing protein n=1 Tax=Methylobacterium TaxID=407 RepID=UPI0013EC4C08|nr:PAS domain-containing protein [Methylobacterium sp. DB0501]NGM36684.1 PAS domain-containing protein [Methylobacterium sp. DB0501]
MKHPTSRMLHAYWNGLRGARAAPERGEIEPGEIRHVLADSLILEIDAPDQAATVRLAGTRLCALFGAELRGHAFAGLWGEAPAADPWRLIEVVIQETTGVVVGLVGVTEAGETLDLELLLLPLRHRGKTQARVIGSLSPSVIPTWLGLRPIVALRTVSLRILTPEANAAPAPLAAPPPAANDEPGLARRKRFVVHHGGRA